MPPEEIRLVSPQGGAVGVLHPCSSSRSEIARRSFEDLRSVQWRIHLGILPCSPSSSVDDLRRVTADFRRMYASLRRRLLVDTHAPKEGSNSPDLVIDNPLSQNPDSTWSRFFRNAELEKMVDHDLSRLYPEHGSYFQTPGCQGMLRRILLLWCLRHPEYGYRQGMHELLAPLLFVLQVDVEHLSEVRKLHEDHFTDRFDGLAFEENDFTYNFDLKNFPDFTEEDSGSHGNPKKFSSRNELDPNVQTIVLLSDAYGAEGELGIVLSDKFMEHDAYCMFDALMSRSHGAVAMADFFSTSPADGSHTGLPPIIEASSALYHLLSIVDSSLHSHLVELGVEPQYFALRWLRVLFGREFSLEDLLKIWDEIFASDNSKIEDSEDASSGFEILNSQRGAFISAIAVSMILHMRSSLLATENATKCLQRLLNFPQNISLKKMITKAKSLQTLALESNVISTLPSFCSGHHRSKSVVVTGHYSSSNSVSPATLLSLVPDSYWEEKWRFMQKAEELSQNTLGKLSPSNKKRWSEKGRLSLSRTESAPSPSKTENRKDLKSNVRRSLLEDLSRELGLEEDNDKLGCEDLFAAQSSGPTEGGEQVCAAENATSTAEACPSGNTGSEDNSSLFSVSTSPRSEPNDQENDLEQSSVASNLTVDMIDDESNNGESFRAKPELQLPVSDPPEDLMESLSEGSVESKSNNDMPGKLISGAKDRRSLSGKFPWFWKFGRNSADTGTQEKDSGLKVSEVMNGVNSRSGSPTVDKPCISSPSFKGDSMDQNVMVTLRNLGQSMIDNIQIIESVFQQDRAQMGLSDGSAKNFIVGKGQVKAVAALKELRKISNLLSEM